MSLFIDVAKIILEKKDADHAKGLQLNLAEEEKVSSRTEIINFLLQGRSDANYLEIGVRNPEDNFNYIVAANKYSVDPGVEFEENPVDFQMTSDEFFQQLAEGKILKDTLFDVLFIDGLHLAEQVDRDINNALQYIKEDGFIVLHDCNPPSEWHARETYNYKLTPAKGCWNGTTWKAFVNARKSQEFFSCCIDTDWGVGIISKKIDLGLRNEISNPYWEYSIFEKNRTEILNLISFRELQEKIK
ncbi:MAG: class I SAM-dependent methyltransferase [Ekhidna sp.]|nr:class I SAM-dependent methyltransferase [Ekhidna sp.]